MRTWHGVGIAAMAVVAWAAPAARAESVAREAVSVGALTGAASQVAVVRADTRQTVGPIEVLTATVLEAWKGTSASTLQIVVRGELTDVRQGDELIVFLAPVDGEQMGLVAGTYHTAVAPPRWALVRVTPAARLAWGERVRAHLSGDADALARLLAVTVGAADKRLASDALVDLFLLQKHDLERCLASEDRRRFADHVLTGEGRKRFEGELPYAVFVCGVAKAVEAYDALLALARESALPGLPCLIGETLQKLDAARARTDVAAGLAGTPEQPPEATVRIRLLEVARGMAAADLWPAVEDLLALPDDAVRRWALVTAGHLGNLAAIPTLASRLDAGPGDDPCCAAYALHRIGTPEAMAHVVRGAASHPRPEIRAWLEKFRQRPAMVGEDVLVKLARGY